MDENFFPDILSLDVSSSESSDKGIEITTISGKEEVFFANEKMQEETTEPLKPNPLYQRDIIRVVEE